MRQILKIVSVIIIANLAVSTVISAEKREPEKEVLNSQALSEFKRAITKEFSVGSSPLLRIKNEFGKINIIEGEDDKIIFKITITGKGRNNNAAKEYSESVNVNFKQSGNDISAETILKKINCNNCGRDTDYEVIVPKKTKLLLENKFGDVSIGNSSEPMELTLEFGKLYANSLSEAKIEIRHGGSTINRCERLKISSRFSDHKLGEIGSLSGKVSHGGFDIEEVGSIDVESGFSKVTIDRLRNSFNTNSFSHSSLRIKNIDNNFSGVKIDARFSNIRLSLDNHNFKAILHTKFGSIKTGNIVFLEKTLDKKDAIVGIAGKIKEPSSSVEISTEHGNIVLD